MIQHAISDTKLIDFSFAKNAVAGLPGIAPGLVLCTWIILQVDWISFSGVLQPVFLLVGEVKMITLHAIKMD